MVAICHTHQSQHFRLNSFHCSGCELRSIPHPDLWAHPIQLNDPDVTNIPLGFRILSGLFQAVSTRTAGLAVINLATLHPAMQVSYMGKQYPATCRGCLLIGGSYDVYLGITNCYQCKKVCLSPTSHMCQV